MQPAVLVRLRPQGAWRIGPGTGDGEGARERIDALYRSDRLFAAVTIAARQLGWLEEWLDATARSSKAPAVCVSSLYPFQADTLFVSPPSTLWPPPPSLVVSPNPAFLAKLRWEHARFIPVALAQSLMLGQKIQAEQWTLDAESGCLLRRDRTASTPFRRTVRRRVPVDRLTGQSADPAAFACVDFDSGTGLWCAIRFHDEDAAGLWSDRFRGAFSLLADTGFGGGRGSGWGQCLSFEWQEGRWPQVLLPRLNESAEGGQRERNRGAQQEFWLLSLYSPASGDRIHWDGGHYRLTPRGRPGSSMTATFVEEGSVITAEAEPVGRALDFAGSDEPHPRYRAGYALTVRLPESRVVPAEEEEIATTTTAVEEIAPTEREPSSPSSAKQPEDTATESTYEI